jgi:hypothetical protein
MNKCGFWQGGHNWVIAAKATTSETWYNTYQGCKIAGSEHTRHRPTVIKRCTKCQQMMAEDGWNRESVSVEYAAKKIVQLGGIIEDQIRNSIDSDKEVKNE